MSPSKPKTSVIFRASCQGNNEYDYLLDRFTFRIFRTLALIDLRLFTCCGIPIGIQIPLLHVDFFLIRHFKRFTNTMPRTPKSSTAKNTASSFEDGSNARLILDKSKKLFQQKGYSGTSMNDIILACDVSKPTVYHHFQDKENLFTEVLIDMLRNGYHYLQGGIKPNQTIRQQLLRLTEGFMKNTPTSMITMLRDAKEQLSPLSYKKVADAYRYYMVSTFEVLFSQGVDTGELKEHAPTDMALLYLSVIDSYTSNRTAYQGREFDYKATSEFIVSVLLDGLAK